jgi:SAM-dependent methyltransferase
MTRVFGEVAALYDDVRPDYPDAVRQAILDYAGGRPGPIVELGAGTGKATELLLHLQPRITAIEPDERMAAVLRAKYPQVEVVNATFEEWTAPAGRAGLIACASAWHWLDPGIRHHRAAEALKPGGVLALFLNRFRHRDPQQQAAIDALLYRMDPAVTERPLTWPYDEVKAAGVWIDVEEHTWHRHPELDRDRYLALMQTFGPFRTRAPALQERTLAGLGELIDGFGGSVVLDLRTVLVLARRH